MSKAAVVAAYCVNFPTTASRTLARKIANEKPDVFPDLEHARRMVRYVRGLSGVCGRLEASANFERIQLQYASGGLAPSGLPLPEPFDAKPVRFNSGKWLLLSDTQIPWHDEKALAMALNTGTDRGITDIYLNGDIADCYQLSRFWRIPSKALFVRERYALSEFFDTLRERFPKARIRWKQGNHDERIEIYLATHAPEIYDEELHNWNTILGLKKNWDIETIDSWRSAHLGKLLVLHGHEFGPGFSPPVTPARWLFLKTLCPAALASHYHNTSQDNNPSADGELLSTWSTGCLCGLSPRWMPRTRWNHGFAIVNIEDKKGNFEVENYRILPSGKLVR